MLRLLRNPRVVLVTLIASVFGARMLYVLTGKSYDEAAGKLEASYLRWVVYVPFATAASTGLGTKALPGVPHQLCQFHQKLHLKQEV